VIVDTSAVIAMLLGEPEAAALAQAVNAASNPAISAVSWAEAAIVAENRSAAAAAAFGPLMDRLRLDIVPFTAVEARLALDAHRRFGKGRHPAGLNLGDCFAYALAVARDEPLLFKGDDFARTDVKAAI
jgi:ribonuclease VapC